MTADEQEAALYRNLAWMAQEVHAEHREAWLAEQIAQPALSPELDPWRRLREAQAWRRRHRRVDGDLVGALLRVLLDLSRERA